MEGLGFVLHIFPGFEGYPLFDRPDAHVHVCAAGGEQERRHTAFPDFLRADPDAALAYAAEKRLVAIEAAGDGPSYVDGKDASSRHSSNAR